MSKIPDLGKDLSGLPGVLATYEDEFKSALEHITIDKKTLAKANKENPSWLLFYSARRSELYAILKYVEAQVERTRGRLFKSYTETSSRDLSDRGKDKYIDQETTYLNKYEIYLEVKELYDKFDSVVEGFKARGYALNNLTKLRIEQLENETV